MVTNEKTKADIDAQLKADGSTVGKAKYVVGDCVAYGANKGYQNLKTVEIGTNVVSIGREAFANCPKLKKAVIRSTN